MNFFTLALVFGDANGDSSVGYGNVFVARPMGHNRGTCLFLAFTIQCRHYRSSSSARQDGDEEEACKHHGR